MNQQRLHELVDYDPETGVFIHRVKRGPTPVGTVCGRVDPAGYRRIKLDGRIWAAHRLAWLYVTGEIPPNDIDHINGARDDNRIANLRPATRKQNSENRRQAHRNNKSGLQGVSARRGRWIAEIMHDGKRTYLGCFDTPEAAHQSYLAAKAKLHEYSTIDVTAAA